MKINLLKGQIVEINLDEEECTIKIDDKVFSEKITALDVAIVSDEYDEKFKDSFIRNIYIRCIGVGTNKYKMCVNYSFEA